MMALAVARCRADCPALDELRLGDRLEAVVLAAGPSNIQAVSVPYPLFINTLNGVEKPTFFRVGVSLAP